MSKKQDETTTGFDAKAHLRIFERRQKQLDGSYQTVQIDYLDVKWRVLWFREAHPEGSIETRLLSVPGMSPAVVQATVILSNGVTTTGFGSCAEDSWSDYLEKAETRAIGRALALLGFGTQFVDTEFDEAISDAPVERNQLAQGSREAPQASANGAKAQQPRQRAARASATAPRSQSDETEEMQAAPTGQVGAKPEPMTPNQQKYLYSLAREANLPARELDEICSERFGVPAKNLSKDEASTVIRSLQELREEQVHGASA